MTLIATNPFLPPRVAAATTRFQKQPLLQTSPLGLKIFRQQTQGSSFLATLVSCFLMFLVWLQLNGKMSRPLACRPRDGGADVIVQPSDLLSPKPSQIHPCFCVPNSNRCQSDASNTSARIRKYESEHIRNYE